MRQDAGVDDTTPDGEYDNDLYDSEFEYNSDDSAVTQGWESDDNSLSSDEGMLLTEWYTKQQLLKSSTTAPY